MGEHDQDRLEEALPEALRARILADAYDYLDAIYPPAARDEIFKRLDFVRQGAMSRTWQRAGWYLAAVCLIAAVLGWYPRLVNTKPPPPPLAELRLRLLAEAPDVMQTSWLPVTLPVTSPVQALERDESRRQMRGDIVWSTARQQGFMRFEGMPAVDPAVSGYQLWIFDAHQDERYPIDGGVFDITEETGEVIIRMSARIPVSQPRLFAITLEKPGGVVVSKRDHLLLIAKVE